MAGSGPRCLHIHDQWRESARSRGSPRSSGAACHLITVRSDSVLRASCAVERRRLCWRLAGSATPFPQEAERGFETLGKAIHMKRMMLAALSAATMAFAVPAAAQDVPLVGG